MLPPTYSSLIPTIPPQRTLGRRRSFPGPLVRGCAGLLAVIGAYLTTAHPLLRYADEEWYRLVERRSTIAKETTLPPVGKRWLGMYRPELPWDYERFDNFGQKTGTKGAIVSWYQAWGAGPEHAFKLDAVQKLHDRGLFPMITWEPWLSGFGPRSHTDAKRSLLPIIAGEFDDYIRSWAREATRARKPLFLRPFHEMGNPAYFWSTAYDNPPETQIEAWRHVVRIFREEGARNVAFVWTPHAPADAACWPGAEWVDWVGYDVFNYGTVTKEGHWQSFMAILQDRMKASPKWRGPILVAEAGCSGVGGDCSTWWRDAFAAISGLPTLKAFVVYDHPAYSLDHGASTLDWGFSHRPEILPRLAEPLSEARFVGPFERR